MPESGAEMVSFLGATADPRLLAEDLGNLPVAEQRHEAAPRTRKHDRLVAAGTVLTGTSLTAGSAMVLYGGGESLFGTGGTFDVVLAVVGAVLVATHWGWVHVAEYLGIVSDDRQQRYVEVGQREWLATIAPHPRLSVTTTVLADASTRVQRLRHEPILLPEGTFTFARYLDGEQTYDSDAPAQDIAAAVETMRRQARLETDRFRGNWEAAHAAYQASLLHADNDQQRLAAQRAAANALSEHINASLLEPPLVE